MLWAVLSLAIVTAAGVSARLGFALAREAYGYPVGHHLVRQGIRRRDEQRFRPADIREVDAAFRRVIGSYRAD